MLETTSHLPPCKERTVFGTPQGHWKILAWPVPHLRQDPMSHRGEDKAFLLPAHLILCIDVCPTGNEVFGALAVSRPDCHMQRSAPQLPGKEKPLLSKIMQRTCTGQDAPRRCPQSVGTPPHLVPRGDLGSPADQALEDLQVSSTAGPEHGGCIQLG